MSEAVVHDESGAMRDADKAPRGRTRTCVGCAEHVSLSDAADLVRLVFGPSGEVAVDARGGAAGRGAHVHARAVCIERAARGGIARATKGKALGIDAPTLARAIQEAMDRRIEGLFMSAVRAGQLARGVDAVTASCQRGEAQLVVVACDAGEVANHGEVRRAIAEGHAVAWGDALRLGRLTTGQDEREVAVAAISSRSIAHALQQAVRISDACAGPATGSPTPPRRGGGRSRNRASDAQKAARGLEENAGGKRRLSGVGSNLERGA